LRNKLSEASFISHYYAFCSFNNYVPRAGGDKREAILRAAIRVFAHNGYFNSKVADIAREAGVADGTVYLYFKSKEDILHSIFDRSVEEALAPRESRSSASPIRAKSCARSRCCISSDSAPIAIWRSCFRSNCAARPSLWKSFPPPALPSISR
jgi:hypothetical protein